MIGKLIKKEKSLSLSNYNKVRITFEIEDYYSIKDIEQLENNKIYKFEPKEYKSNRTIQQNKMMWKYLELIAQKELGGRTDSDYVMELYAKMLEKSGAKYEYLMALPETIPELLKVFRTVKIVEYRDYNNKQMAVIKCFYGSSKMNTKEMKNLIDTILDYAYNIGLYIDKEEIYYEI